MASYWKFGLSVVLVLMAVSASFASLVNTDVKRTILLTSPIARHDVSIQIKNQGSSPVATYDLVMTEAFNQNLASFVVSNNDAKVLSWKASDQVRPIQTSSGELIERVVLYTITFAKPLAADETTTLRIIMSFGHMFKPFPESITQSETQLVRYHGDHYLISPYQTEKCVTTVKLASSSIQTSSQLEPTSVQGDTITYGPYANIQPYSLSPMLVHFESNQPFITAKKIIREVEVSHWGNVAIEDFASWEHTGAQLKGGFSRYTYQMVAPGSTSNALREMEFALPEGAADVYYKDAIGNISTSHWNKRRLQIQPRYPLFGGWQTTFCTGYNLPLEKYVGISKKASDLYTLTIPVGPNHKSDIFVEELITKVILPEGATDIKVETPYPMKQTMESRTTYLDVTGRPVVVLQRNHLVNEQLAKNIRVTYRFTATDLAREPALLIAGFFVMFVVVIFFSRLSLNIMPEDPNAKQQRQAAVKGHLKKYQELLDRRLQIAVELDKEAEVATSNYDKHKQTAKDNIDAIVSTTNNMLHQLDKYDSSSADIIREIETLLQAKFKAQQEYHVVLRSKKAVDSSKLKRNYTEHDDSIAGLRAQLTL